MKDIERLTQQHLKEGVCINSILNVIIDCFALTILFIIFLNIHRHNNPYLLEQKLFGALIWTNAWIIIFDMLMWLLDGKSGYLSREIYLLVTVCYYVLNPVICMMWYFYADYQIYRSEKHLKKVLIPMLIPACINLILSILSIFNHLLFYIDENNIYHRGNLFYSMAAICFFYLIYTMILIILKHKRIRKQDFIPILVFAVPPFIGGIIQSLFYGFSLIWACVTISILIIFINIQNDQLHKDYLTGLFNRRQLDKYLQLTIQNIDSRLLAGIMIDLNSFKMINDLYGHSIGDQALQHTADILRKTFRKNDFIARYGGDEFIILGMIKERDDLFKSIERLKENVAQFNAQKIVPYTISFSIGYDSFSGQSETTITEFLKHLDHLMYQDKQNYINLRN